MSLFFKAKEATKMFLFDHLSIFQYFFKAKRLYIKCSKIRCVLGSFFLFLSSFLNILYSVLCNVIVHGVV